MPNIWNAIYLGNSATLLDSTEGNQTAENASLFVGNTYGSIGDPLATHIVEVTAYETAGEFDVLDQDNFYANEQLSYDLGGGTQFNTFDALVEYNATITYMDGSTATITAVVFQDSSGNMFLAPEATYNTDVVTMEAQGIRSLSLDSVSNADSSGLFAVRVDTAFICYAPGTFVDTPKGPCTVEDLQVGDLVETLDHGPQVIRWVHHDDHPLENNEMESKPVLVAAGALGSGRPAQDLIVSPHHRMLVGGKRQLQDWFHSEALAPAKSLTSLPGIRHMKGKTQITWVHFACDQHEIVTANGCLSESLLLGPMVLNGLTIMERRELTTIFGPAPTHNAALNGPAARECLKVGEVRRHIAKCKRDVVQRTAKEIRKWDVDLAMEQWEAERLGLAPSKSQKPDLILVP